MIRRQINFLLQSFKLRDELPRTDYGGRNTRRRPAGTNSRLAKDYSDDAVSISLNLIPLLPPKFWNLLQTVPILQKYLIDQIFNTSENILSSKSCSRFKKCQYSVPLTILCPISILHHLFDIS